MRSQKSRILINNNGQDLAFSNIKFKAAMTDYCCKKSDEGILISKTELRQNLAEHLHLSQDSIKNYAQGYNGPMDIEVVKKMAEYLDVDWKSLMKEVSPEKEKKREEMEKNANYYVTDNLIKEGSSGNYKESECDKTAAWNAVREVYSAIFDFVTFFEQEYSIPLNMKDEGVNEILHAYSYCRYVLRKNLLDIPEQTYKELDEFIEELRYWIWIYEVPAKKPNEENSQKISEEKTLKYFPQLYMMRELDEDSGLDELDWGAYITFLLLDSFYYEIGKVLCAYRPHEPNT